MSEAPHEMIQIIEEIFLKAWPSLQQILYDGWILRFANSYTKRAHSVNPVYLSNQDVHEKIERCERIYVEKNLKPIFRITPLAHPKNLDELLANAGYEKKDVSSVQVLKLGSFQPQATNDIRLEAEFSQDWLDSVIQLGSVTIDSQEALAGILRNIASKKCLAVLMKENQVVSCGLGVLENH